MRSPFASAAVVTLACAVALAAPACAKEAAERTVLQTEDLQSTTDGFDPSALVGVGAFTDGQSIDVSQVQLFLERTPYNRGSFLATYQSNGVRAADAIVRAAARYSLNPLVFLVRAEMAEGLLGEEFYPAPPSRVEYVFGCGCTGSGAACDPSLAGFDNQVSCLGRALRASLDEIAKTGTTAGQWAPGQARLTLDGVTVTPADPATAALYQYTPIVALDKAGGNWLFWNLWQKYALAIGYFGGSPFPAAVARP